jgi:hypothetical protein
MGYRHQVISDITVIECKRLPKWFTEKYKKAINFSNDFWVSYTEYKRYGVLKDFNTDVQKVLIEDGQGKSIQLVYFADESHATSPDISHIYITAEEIVEMRPTGWEIDEIN